MPTKLKKVFITGITGMVGSHLADYLIKKTDWEIHGFLRWRSSWSNISHLFPMINANKRVFLHYGDLNDFSSLYKCITNIKPNYIFHLAAQSYPQTSFDSPADTLKTNIIGTCNLLESVRIINIKPVIHVCSSSEIFGRVSKDKLPIKENCTFHPASPYAISKVGADLLGRFYSEAYKMKVLTTRMFTHTGPRRGDVFAESSFAKQIAMIENNLIEPIVKVGNLKSLRTYADVRDAVRAYHMLVTINPISGEFYNIGGNHVVQISEMLDKLLSLSKVKNIKIKKDSKRIRPIDADLQIPDTSKFMNHTGWKPKISFHQSMKDLLNYWRNKIKVEKNILQR